MGKLIDLQGRTFERLARSQRIPPGWQGIFLVRFDGEGGVTDGNV